MKIFRFLLLTALITLAGCVDSKEEFTINPDGSGKVFYSISLKSMDLGALMGGQTASSPALDIKNNLKDLLEKSQGVDAWKDVSYKILEDGRSHIEATGYFSDINKLAFSNSLQDNNNPEIKMTDIAGKMTLEFVTKYEEDGTNTVQKDLTDEQIEQQIKMYQMGYQQGKVMMQNFFKDIKFERIMHLPGKVIKSTNFNKIDDSTVSINFDGNKLMKSMDVMMADTDYIRKMLKEGKDPMKQPDQMKMNGTLFGEAALVSVTVAKDSKSLFDYQAEMQAAKAAFGPMKQKLYSQLDELAKQQPQADQNSQLQNLITNMQSQSAQADTNDVDANDTVADSESDVNSISNADTIRKAMSLERSRKTEEAIELYLQVVDDPDAKDKDVVKARTYLSRSYIRTREYDKAKEQLETIIADFSDNRAVVARAKRTLKRVKKLLGEPLADPATRQMPQNN